MDSFDVDAIETNRPCRPLRSERESIENCVPDILFSLDSFSPDDRVQFQAAIADLEFVEGADRREQIVAVCKILWVADRRRQFTFEDVGKFFGGISGAMMDQRLQKAQEIRQASGRPRTFAAEAERWIETVVKERYDARAAFRSSESPDLLQYRNHIRSMPSVRSVLGIPKEAERVAVLSEIFGEWYPAPATKIKGVP
jgi:hypothetical protein